MEAEALSVIWRCLTAGGLAMGGAWLTVEWVIGLFNLAPKWKRVVGFMLGVVGVFAIQEAHWIHLAADGLGHNYWSAGATALLSGGLTPKFHDLIKKRVPVLTNGNPVIPKEKDA